MMAIYENFFMFTQNFLSKAQLKNFLMDSSYQSSYKSLFFLHGAIHHIHVIDIYTYVVFLCSINGYEFAFTVEVFLS